jgi:primosomal replication protein N
MYQFEVNPLDVLYARLTFLGKLLSAVCCLWIAVVGTVLVRELTPNDLEHHRAPVIQARVSQCEGDFSRRYACADTILIDGQHNGALQLLMRLGVTLMLPGVAWVMWRGVMLRAERLRGHWPPHHHHPA